MKKILAVHLVYFTALTLVIGIMAAVAGEVTIPNTFTPNTTAKAGEVNANFTAIKNAVDDNFARLPIMWAQTDVDTRNSSGASSAPVSINSVAIVAPSNGFLVISGSVYLENGSGTSQTYALVPTLDGNNVPVQTLGVTGPNDFAASFNATGTGPAAQFTLSYTLTVPIGQGGHTVSQAAGPISGPVNFAYNKNYLTVIFYPDSQGTLTEAPPDADF